MGQNSSQDPNEEEKKQKFASPNSISDSNLETENFAHLWKIHKNVLQGMRQYKASDSLRSTTFLGGQTAGHSWELVMKYFKGQGETQEGNRIKKADAVAKGSVGLFLALKSMGSREHSTKVIATVAFTVLDKDYNVLLRKGLLNCNFLADKSQCWGFNDFVSIKDLLNDDKKYLDDKYFKIHCSIWLQKVRTTSGPTRNKHAMYPAENAAIKVCSDLEKLWETGANHDLILSCGAKEFKVHKIILEARSPVFKAMLQDMNHNIGNITIEGFSESAVEKMIQFIYCAHAEIMDEDMLELLKISRRYGIKELEIQCGIVLQINLTSENAVQTLLAINELEMPDLKQKVIDFIAKEKEQVKRQAIFQNLLALNPILFHEVVIALL